MDRGGEDWLMRDLPYERPAYEWLADERLAFKKLAYLPKDPLFKIRYRTLLGAALIYQSNTWLRISSLERLWMDGPLPDDLLAFGFMKD